jgi:uncharacterized protein (DUF2236 family)
MHDCTSAGRILHMDEKEQDQHARAIQRLAQELGVPAEEVCRFYQEILNTLRRDATVRTYLPILVSRSVKERLRQK